MRYRSLSILVLAVTAAVVHAAETVRPNIVFILTDDQRFNTIRALGNDVIRTPHLDALVESGTTFTRAHIMGAENAAVCTPSRAMILSGRSLFRIDRGGEPGRRGQVIPASNRTLPEALGAGGYEATIIGKWHNDAASLERLFPRGERIYFNSPGNRRSHFTMAVRELQDGKLSKDAFIYRRGAEGEEIKTVVTREMLKGWETESLESVERGYFHTSEVFAKGAVDFLKNQDGKDPFFLYLPFHAPHDPRTAPKEYRDLYPPESIPLPVSFLPEHPFDMGIAGIRDEMLAGYPRTPEEVREHLAEYYAIISHMDAQIGRVMEVLRENGQLENTVIVFTSDSGLAVGDHGLMGKQNLYDAGGVHVPLIFSGPGIPKGVKRVALVYTMDIYPTLCGLAGADVPEGVDGLSLLPVIRGEKEQVRESLYFAYCGIQRGLQDARFKLIESVHEGRRHTQLFDMGKDGDETRNLADDPEYREVLDRMRAELLRQKDVYQEPDDAGPELWEVFGKGG